MAAEIDPESEALVWKLHRELNGFTRTSRRANPAYGISSDKSVAARQQQPPRDREVRSEAAGALGGLAKRSRTDKERDRERERARSAAGAGASGSGSIRRRTSPPSSRQRQRPMRGTDDSEGTASEDDDDEEEEYQSTRTTSTSESQSDSEAQALKRPKAGSKDDREGSKGERDVSKVNREAAARQQRERDRERQRETERQRAREQKERERDRDKEQRGQVQPAVGTSGNPSLRVSGAARPDQGPARKAEGQSAHLQTPQDVKEQDRLRTQAGGPQGAAVHAGGAPAGTSGGAAPALGPAAVDSDAYRQQQQPNMQQLDVHLSPLEAAAAAASGAVKEQAKVSSPLADSRMVKCFHAGVRWGIKLSRQALQTRSDLATALNDAFAGEILSCGRGETLNIVFLDAQGKATEFPSLRGPNGRGKDSGTKWRTMVERAVKIYVRRS